MKKPLIAIAGGLVRDNSNEFLGDNYIKINDNYSKSIVDAGGIPIILPLVNDINVLINQISICNGLLLTGGIDINPLLYKESPQPLLETCNDLIDWFHINLARKALDLNIPILGICRGCQVINVAFGGTLYQDITYATSSPIMHKQKSHLSQRCHYIYVKENSIIYDILGNEYVVNSAHHQSVEKIASNFICTASSEDGIIEAIEMINKPFVVGVQWHPEMMVSYDIKALNLFKRFIESCKI
ncbi:MAG: gamma-glutamyl-gamma-aminobutyrate hydrolase family protein [Clostridium sp.]|nr:gamma-glutamyl-gamma-aminobutyrate hydrolase family protein [Clostridium sp.]